MRRAGYRPRTLSEDAARVPVYSTFTPSHRGGRGAPLVCLHGFMDTWRTWELVLPVLERHHDVLAPTLPGHPGGPRIEGEIGTAAVLDGVERAMDEAGLATAHIAGNSLGGYIALHLAARGRARSVVAFALAGGWAEGDESFRETLAAQARMQQQARAAAPHVDAIVRTPEGRRQATQALVSSPEHIPPDLVAHLIRGVAACAAAEPLIEAALRKRWRLAAERISCPVRVVWGTEDRLLSWPSAAARFRRDWLPHADWVELDGVGHAPQLDVPVEAAQLVVGFTAR
ncbi:MAG TPA: alpha/beta hydrolase [Solirubrobacteraceae bacterium]|nr:alpha/beta hydrolase [Solirubrobacteraceae bacterium]